MVEMRVKSGPGVTSGPPGEPCEQLREALGHWGGAGSQNGAKTGAIQYLPGDRFGSKITKKRQKSGYPDRLRFFMF